MILERLRPNAPLAATYAVLCFVFAFGAATYPNFASFGVVRNLFVDNVVIGDRTFEAEAPSTRILAPTYCESGYLAREVMYCQGSMRLVDPELEAIMSRPRCPARHRR